MPFIINDFNNCFSFVDILYDRFAIKHSIYINCSYDINEKIKKDIKYHNCLTHFICNVKMPKFLFFSFELSDVSQYDIYQFRNLIT